MNVLFLTVLQTNDISERGIYTDLMRKFRDEGHNVFIVSPIERKYNQQTRLIQQDGVTILQIKTPNIQKTNLIEKGLATLILPYLYLWNIRRNFDSIQFDLLLYSTPPITFTKVVRYFKTKGSIVSYLLLKDIFPQNAVDLNLIKKNSLLHKYFRREEKKMYSVSDFIGCMSPSNLNYILVHNKDIDASKVEVCPNSVEVGVSSFNDLKFVDIRRKYKLPLDSVVFIYGGNLGKPQGLDFLLEILESNIDLKDRYFLIVGTGTESTKIKKWFEAHNSNNAQLIDSLPKVEYDQLLPACDVGLIFLDSAFTIPNYPSRLLSYLENKMPILAATDRVSDIGIIAQENNYGFFSENGNLTDFNNKIERFIAHKDLLIEMGVNGYNFLNENYTVNNSYSIIMKHFQSNV